MCLLEQVLDWSTDHVRSRSSSHRDSDHPLRAHGRLGSACGVEYAAQTMAVHGALLAGAAAATGAGPGQTRSASAAGARGPLGSEGTPAAGFLASIRNTRFHVARLDDVAGDLVCHVIRIAGDGGSALYEFELRSDTMCLLDGRATVVLDAGDRFKP